MEEILKMVGDANLDHSSGWYLHGKLEDMCGYDLATIYNMSEFLENIKMTLRWGTMVNDKTEIDTLDFFGKSYLHGIYPVEVYGIQEECVGYFWITDERECIASVPTPEGKIKFTDWYQRGLVCLKSDLEAIKYAEDCYAKNRSNL